MVPEWAGVLIFAIPIFGMVVLFAFIGGMAFENKHDWLKGSLRREDD